MGRSHARAFHGRVHRREGRRADDREQVANRPEAFSPAPAGAIQALLANPAQRGLQPVASQRSAVLSLQRSHGNQAVQTLLARRAVALDDESGQAVAARPQESNARDTLSSGSAPAATVQRVTIAGQSTSNFLFATKHYDRSGRWTEVKDILDKFDREKTTFTDEQAVKSRIDELLAKNNTIFVDGEAVVVLPTGGRANEHISAAAALEYFRRHVKDVTSGDQQKLLVGEGRKTGYGKHGQILYSFGNGTIQYWHAHDQGSMG
jgi:hypothetical protein